jgi:hypothetical protein
VRNVSGTERQARPDLLILTSRFSSTTSLVYTQPMHFYGFWVLCCLSFLIGCRLRTVESSSEINEASGVVRHNDDLVVVDDSAIGAYFRVSLQGSSGPLIPLRQAPVERVPLSSGCLAVDLEGVDQLADGRLVFLSERLRSLIGEDGLIAEYDSLLGEFANRGLEGVTCRALPNNVSRVAVLWEGGYPDYASVPLTLRDSVGRSVMRPLVVIHDLRPGAQGIELKVREAVLTIELEVPKPIGQEPEVQRFRAPDFVWSRLKKKTEEEWGFIVLITSQNSRDRPDYEYHWLQRFDLGGRLVGEPLDLARFLPAQIQRANWEGLSWFERGKSLVLVHEGTRNLPPHAFVLTLPADWQFSPEGWNLL